MTGAPRSSPRFVELVEVGADHEHLVVRVPVDERLITVSLVRPSRPAGSGLRARPSRRPSARAR